MQESSLNKQKMRTSYPLIILGAMFLIGMIYGAILINLDFENMQATISLITSEYTASINQQSVSFGFASAFLSSFWFVFIPYLLGYGAVFQPIILLVPWFKGLGLGFFMANMYLSHGFLGAGFCALVILPQTIISLFCLIISAREALKLSNMFFFGVITAGENTLRIFGHSIKNHEAVTLKTIKLYNIKLLILIGMCLIAAAVNVICILMFSGLFKF